MIKTLFFCKRRPHQSLLTDHMFYLDFCDCFPQYKVASFLQDLDKELEQIHKVMGVEVDVTFDCAGFTKTMSTALRATRSGGNVCLVGMGHGVMSVPLTPAAARYVTVSFCLTQLLSWLHLKSCLTNSGVQIH